jgi:hypothetical protein
MPHKDEQMGNWLLSRVPPYSRPVFPTDSDPLEFRLAVLFEFRQANNSPG